MIIIENKKRMDWLKSRLSIVDEGQSLLNLAEEHNVKINFAKELNYSSMYIPKEKAIYLRSFATNKMMLKRLAINLRHLWQDTLLPFSKTDNLKPRDFIVFKNLLKGDAFAFSKALVKRIEALPHGKRIDNRQSEMREVFRKNITSIDAVINHYPEYLTSIGQLNQKNKAQNEHMPCGSTDRLKTRHLSQSITGAFNNEALSIVISANYSDGFTYLDAISTEDFIKSSIDLIPNHVLKQCDKMKGIEAKQKKPMGFMPIK